MHLSITLVGGILLESPATWWLPLLSKMTTKSPLSARVEFNLLSHVSPERKRELALLTFRDRSELCSTSSSLWLGWHFRNRRGAKSN